MPTNRSAPLACGGTGSRPSENRRGLSNQDIAEVRHPVYREESHPCEEQFPHKRCAEESFLQSCGKSAPLDVRHAADHVRAASRFARMLQPASALEREDL